MRKKIKVVQMKKLIDAPCESNINTVAKENGLSENIHVDCMFLSCHVSGSEWTTLYSCLNVKELHAQSRLEIWSLSNFKGNWTHNHVVRKWTLNHIAKLAGKMPVWLDGWMFVYERSGCGSSPVAVTYTCWYIACCQIIK